MGKRQYQVKPLMEKLTDDDKRKEWACGCVTYVKGEAFVLEPCRRPDCPVEPIVLEESKLKGNRIVRIKRVREA